jgi:hypothetical protein
MKNEETCREEHRPAAASVLLDRYRVENEHDEIGPPPPFVRCWIAPSDIPACHVRPQICDNGEIRLYTPPPTP